MDIKNSVVAILNNQGKIIGTGFVAGENLILTCAHVVEQATAGLNERVTVRFSDNSKVEAAVDQQAFSPSYERDVALLHAASLPQGITALPLGNATGSAGHEFYAYGYAIVTDVQGIGARGKIVTVVDDKKDGRLVQLTSQEPDHGMSGGPVLDEQRGVVVGMVRKGKDRPGKDQNLRNTQTTFATSTETIIGICGQLEIDQLAETPHKIRKLQWVWFPLIFLAVLGVGVGLYFGLRKVEPPVMSGDFRIAVASFYENGDSGQKNLGYDLADSVRLRLEQDLKDLNPQLVITVWGPDKVGAITGKTPGERALYAEKIAENIHADMVIYGVVGVNGNNWQVLPEFYISAQNFYEAREIVGQNDLGTPFDLPGSSNAAWRFEFGKQMFARSKALSVMSVGLGYFALHQYEKSLEIFQSGLDIADWQDDQGKKVLYLMTSNAAARVGDAEMDQHLTEKATADFDLAEQLLDKALEIDPEYARPYIGLANLNYMRAIKPFDESKKREDIDTNHLDKCYYYDGKALAAKNKPPLADVETKVHFSRGQCLFMDALSGRMATAKPAVDEFQKVIEAYGNGANPRVREMAAEAHGRLAMIYRLIGRNDLAVQEYDLAISLLSDYPERQKVYIDHKADVLNITPTP